jgi:hypothetical protein
MRAIACAVFTVSLIALLRAETDQPDLEAIRSATARCALTQCILNAPVLNAPFSADATTVWQPPASKGQAALRATARYYRDSAGRVRVEQRFVGHERAQQILLAPEVDGRTAYVLDAVARTVSSPVSRGLAQMMVGDGGYNQFLLPRSMKRFTVFFVTPDTVTSTGEPAEETLGKATVEGVQVTGTRFATLLPNGLGGHGRAERWVSPELELVIYSRSEDAHFGILEYRLTNIRRSDPRTELFDVPQEYTEIPFEFPVTWEGPYTTRRTKAK